MEDYMIYININYLAFLVAAAASYILGWLWYGPLFGKLWMRLNGTTEMKTHSGGMALTLIGGIIASLLMSWMLAHSIVITMAYCAFIKHDGIPAGLMTAFMIWFGFIAPVTAGSIFYDKKPWSLWFLNNAYWLISLLIMGLILSVWR
jgi:hypothetical protein